jgi:hypothetical protein
MDKKLHPRSLSLFVALILAVCATSATGQQYCGETSLAHAVQVTFAGCGDVSDNISVYEGESAEGALLPLVKASSGYWEADRKSFDPVHLTLCSPDRDCHAGKGCARSSQTLAIDRGSHRVCAARYVIPCKEKVWKIHVDTEPGRWLLVYKTQSVTEKPQQGGKLTPFDLCNLAYDELVEPALQFPGSNGNISIPLKPIHIGSFGHGQTVNISREELVRELKAALRIKQPLPAAMRDSLPKLVTFKLIDH